MHDLEWDALKSFVREWGRTEEGTWLSHSVDRAFRDRLLYLCAKALLEQREARLP